MEKKKLLLISVSVGLFLVIVIGVSILAFSPRNYSVMDYAQATASVDSLSEKNRTEGIISETPPPVPIVEVVPPPTPVTADGQIQNASSNENIIYINGENAENPVRVERLSDGNTKTYINIPSTPVVKIENTPATAGGQTPSMPVPETKPVSKPAAETKQPSKPTPKPVAAPKPAPKPAAPRQDDYWVQAGSFSNKRGADEAKEFLAGKGITSLVQNSMVNGKVYYRVRVGPYSSQSEANYWLSLIKSLDGMGGSMVWKTSN
ncbi:MAG: SPOR domain-containing protein [Spirochaetaceae bacterium]|jgi:DedD protein|nr:SPOR domain-containing protein [Spirochaetaceae bacterium]